MSRWYSRWVVCVGLLIGIIVVSVRAQAPESLPLCPAADGPICYTESAWTTQEIQAAVGKLEPGQGGFFVSGKNQLTVVFRSSNAVKNADGGPSLILNGETRMKPVEHSDLWTINLVFEGVNEAILSVGLVDRRGNTTQFIYPFMTWYGPEAPSRPLQNRPLQGTVQSFSFKSAALGGMRMVYSYLPPHHDPEQTYPVIYMTDGETLPSYAAALDYQIAHGKVRPLILVGVASPPALGENLRGQELVPGRDPARFNHLAQLFTEELRTWAETQWGASKQRQERAFFGVSNGGLFAMMMTVQHSDLYGVAFPFSAGASAGFEAFTLRKGDLQLPLRIYSTAGTLEPIFLKTTRAFMQSYREAGAEVVFREGVAGHDEANWLRTFVDAVQWAFPFPLQ